LIKKAQRKWQNFKAHDFKGAYITIFLECAEINFQEVKIVETKHITKALELS
jgi:hypothetical protein